MGLEDPRAVGVDLPVQLLGQEPVRLNLLLAEALPALQLCAMRDALLLGIQRQGFAGGLKAQLPRGGHVVVVLLSPHVPQLAVVQ
eukprot:7982555-Alexandrium_andersonii.AAC.1